MSVYENLPLGPNQIRLQTVSQPTSDDENDPIHCSLEVVNLTDETPIPQYYALSYTWGAPAEYGKFKGMTSELNHPITCQGKLLWVTENLGAFLKYVRKASWLSGKKFWIDAICIDQQDMDEKSRQVKSMSHIYSSAKKVIMWLGEEDQYTRTAFRALERISELVISNYLDYSPDYLRSGGCRLKLDHVSDREAWLSVGKLFQRCYFIRSWTIQEIILSREVKVVCGERQIDWDVLVVTSRFFSQTGWKVFLDNLAIDYSEEVPLPSYNHVPAMLYCTRRDRPQQHWTTTLLYALKRSRDFKATDPRDKVYCLLSLIEEFIRDKPRLDPVYAAQTVATTYTNVAIQLLEEGEDLYLLSCIEGKLFQHIDNLPSWVPDWICGKSTGLLIAGYKRYFASGTMTQRPQIDVSALTLSLRGIKVDEVTIVGEGKHQVLDGQPFSGWLEIVTSLPRWYREVPEEAGGEHRVEVFWRTILTNTTGRPPKIINPGGWELQSSFVKWLQDKVRDQLRHPEHPEGENLSKLCADLLGPGDMCPASDGSQKTIGSQDIEFETRLAWAKHLRLFRTRSGYLGLGSECVQEGDSVWIIPSSRVPLIFRPARKEGKGGNRWQLVGGTYLHGVMNGEIVCPCCSEKSQDEIESLWETIMIE
jgi:Heterokaryon incompatibility protein (HET)